MFSKFCDIYALLDFSMLIKNYFYESKIWLCKYKLPDRHHGHLSQEELTLFSSMGGGGAFRPPPVFHLLLLE